MCWLQTAELLRHYPPFLLAILAVLGLVECFCGAWAWKFLRGFNGVFAGAFVGALLGLVLLRSPFMAVAGLVAGAVGGAALFATVEFVGTFGVSLATGASSVAVVCEIAHVPLTLTVAIGMAFAGLATAGAAVVGGRRAIVVVTALAGAQQLAAIALAWARPEASAPVFTVGELGIFVALAGLGLAVQWRDLPQQSSAPE